MEKKYFNLLFFSSAFSFIIFGLMNVGLRSEILYNNKNDSEENVSGFIDKDIEKLIKSYYSLLKNSDKGISFGNESILKNILKVIKATYKNNKDLKISRAEILKANDKKLKSFSGFLPKVNLSASYSKDIIKGSSGISSAGINAGLNVYNGMSSINASKIANNEVKIALFSYIVKEQEVILSVLEKYVKVIELNLQVKTDEQICEMMTVAVNVAKSKFEVGDLDIKDYNLAVIDRDSMIIKCSANKIKLIEAISDFELMTGIKFDSVTEELPNFSNFIPKTINEATDIAVKENAKIIAFEYNKQSSERKLEVAISGFHPTLNVGAKKNYDITNDSFSPLNFSAELSIPLFSGFESVADLKIAKKDLAGEIIKKEQAVGGIISDVDTLYKTIDILISGKKILENKLRDSLSVLKADLQSYSYGSKAITAIINSQKGVRESLSAIIENEGKIILTQLKILEKLGRLNIDYLVSKNNNHEKNVINKISLKKKNGNELSKSKIKFEDRSKLNNKVKIENKSENKFGVLNNANNKK